MVARIKPFMGVRYNAKKIRDLSTVVSQPHDRVRHGLQGRYHDLSEHNVVRLIKGKTWDGDENGDNAFTRAGDTYRSWMQQGVLARDRAPALYVLRQSFTLPDGSERVRLGLIAALELSGFDEGVVLPHEDTLPGTVDSRLELLRGTSVNFGSVLTLYSGTRVDELLASVVARPPLLELREHHEAEVLQQLWMLTDPAVVCPVVEELSAQQNLVIADGHHRYQASLEYRDEMRRRYPDAPRNAGFNYRLATLVSMDDPDLTILPTHRLVHTREHTDVELVLARAKEYFRVEPVRGQAELTAWLRDAEQETRPCFGFYDGLSAGLKLRRPEVLERLLPSHSPHWRLLDVTVAHELFIERVLGISKQAVSHEGRIEFLRDPQMGYRAVNRGEAEAMLLMNPTRIEQVRACSLAGERMPQKSTDFYPKMITGLVMLPIGADERL